MSGRFVRESKLRNVYGAPCRKDQQYDGIRVTKHNNVGMCCAVNPKFMAVVTQAAGGGSFLVLPIAKCGRLDINQPQVTGHRSPVIDLAWSPFNDNCIASCDENGAIMIWEICDEGLQSNMNDPLLELNHHQKRVVALKWHPLVENVLLSCGLDNKIFVWNLDDGVPITEITCSEMVQDTCWNYDGSLLATTTKDKMVRIYEPFKGQLKKEFKAHDSSKEQRVQLLKNNKVFTTGFTRMSQRQYTLWDLNDLSKPLVDEQLDQTNAPLNIFYDPDMSMLYLVGKGDTVIRYYEITEEAPYIHYITTYQSSSPQRGMGFMPKRGCNVNACEIARFYKVVASSSLGSIEPVSMIVPRKSELYQADIFPDTLSNEPAMSIEEWQAGKTAQPKLMSMELCFTCKQDPKASKPTGLRKAKGLSSTTAERAAPATQTPKPFQPAWTPAPAAANSESQSQHIEELVAEIGKLKAIVSGQEKRIEALEQQLAH